MELKDGGMLQEGRQEDQFLYAASAVIHLYLQMISCIQCKCKVGACWVGNRHCFGLIGMPDTQILIRVSRFQCKVNVCDGSTSTCCVLRSRGGVHTIETRLPLPLNSQPLQELSLIHI